MNESNDENKIKISGIVKESTVDGPGFRYVVFTQGCPHHCKGCHNPQTHSFDGGSYIDIDTILEDVKKNPLLRGVTISGGEPFMQAKKIAKLLSKIDRKKLSTIVYTALLIVLYLVTSDVLLGPVSSLLKVEEIFAKPCTIFTLN